MGTPSSRAPKDLAELRGNLALTDLSDVVDYLVMSHATGVLEVTKMPDEILARLEFHAGELRSARVRDREGPRVLEEVKGWAKGLFYFKREPSYFTYPPIPQAGKTPSEAAGIRSAPGENGFLAQAARTERDTTAVLADVVAVPGIQAAFIIARDGFLLESAGASSLAHTEELGTVLASAVETLDRLGNELTLQTFQDLFIDYGDAVVLCRPVGAAVVVILAHDPTKLGMIRHKVKGLLADLHRFF